MKDFSDYIESCLKGYPNDETAFRYKKQVYDSMVNRVKQVKSYGLKDEDVIYDLIVDENKDVLNGYFKYLEEEKEKKRRRDLPKYSGMFVGALVLAFLALGFLTDLWHPGWLIIEGGVTILIIGLLMFAVSRLNKTKWYPISRVLVAGSVMIGAQFIFLVLRIPLHIMNAYLIFLAAPALMFICDLVLATVTKQRLLIVNYLICVPVVTIFLYAILGIIGAVAWDPGWLMIIGALVADILIVVGVIMHNKKYSYKPEVEDSWKEN